MQPINWLVRRVVMVWVGKFRVNRLWSTHTPPAGSPGNKCTKIEGVKSWRCGMLIQSVFLGGWLGQVTSRKEIVLYRRGGGSQEDKNRTMEEGDERLQSQGMNLWNRLGGFKVTRHSQTQRWTWPLDTGWTHSPFILNWDVCWGNLNPMLGSVCILSMHWMST